jgi:hypothetical protein
VPNAINLTPDANGKFIQALCPSTTASVAIGGTSVQLTIPSNTEVVRIAATADCYIEFGANPTATDESMLFPYGVEVFRLPLGVTKIAVLQVSTSGVLAVTKLI